MLSMAVPLSWALTSPGANAHATAIASAHNERDFFITCVLLRAFPNLPLAGTREVGCVRSTARRRKECGIQASPYFTFMNVDRHKHRTRDPARAARSGKPLPTHALSFCCA